MLIISVFSPVIYILYSLTGRNVVELIVFQHGVIHEKQHYSNSFTLTKKGKVTVHLMKYMELDTQDHIITFTKFADTWSAGLFTVSILNDY